MRDRHKALAWKSCGGVVVMLALVGVALAQAQRRGRGAVVKSATRGAFP